MNRENLNEYSVSPPWESLLDWQNGAIEIIFDVSDMVSGHAGWITLHTSYHISNAIALLSNLSDDLYEWDKQIEAIHLAIRGLSQYKNTIFPKSKVHRANVGHIWGRQDPGGPHVGPQIFAICVTSIWIPILNIRRSCNHLIFNNFAIPVPGKMVFMLRRGPGTYLVLYHLLVVVVSSEIASLMLPYHCK